MGTKYTNTTISGYNASPPSDDGTAVGSNEVKWSFIKTKIGDALKDFATSINDKLLTHVDESVLDKGTTYTTVAADHKRTINVTAGVVISLGDATTMAAGYIVTVKNSHTAAITVDLATGTDTLDGTVDGSVSLAPDAAMTFLTNADPGYIKKTELWSTQFVIKASDETVNNSDALQDDDDLQITLEANAVYIAESWLEFFNSSGGNQKHEWVEADGTYQAIKTVNTLGNDSSATQAQHYEGSTATNWASAVAAGDKCVTHTLFTIQTGGSGGLFKLQWAQQTASATDLVLKTGSWLKAVRVG